VREQAAKNRSAFGLNLDLQKTWNEPDLLVYDFINGQKESGVLSVVVGKANPLAKGEL
jgi:hypothetical protein